MRFPDSASPGIAVYQRLAAAVNYYGGVVAANLEDGGAVLEEWLDASTQELAWEVQEAWNDRHDISQSELLLTGDDGLGEHEWTVIRKLVGELRDYVRECVA